MINPAEHGESRNLVESILKYIPGFRGYLEKETRRESDDLARQHLSQELDRCKSGFDTLLRALLDAGQIDQLPRGERVRTQLDTIQSRIQGGVQGYSGFFDFVRVDEETLDDVYQHDLSLVRDVGELREFIENSKTNTDQAESTISELLNRCEALQQRVAKRSEILQGLATNF